MSSNNNESSVRSLKVSNVGDMKREGIKWQSLMKKIAFESKGLKKKLEKLRNTNKTLLEQIPELSPDEMNKLVPLLKAFTTRHQSHHRPIALVSSGGTASDLEVHAVRYLDNFSTGTRGAISVEEFLKRGYAVIHLWREGSAAPYSRVLSQMLGAKQGNHGLSFDAVGKLFDGQQGDDEIEEVTDQDTKRSHTDPWLTSTTQKKKASSKPKPGVDQEHGEEADTSNSRMNLTKHILNSTTLQIKLRERAAVVKEGMLLTVPFRTVEEYMAKLKLCTEAIDDCQSLGLIYLAAAVSDFYVPKEEKSEHKIQSSNHNINGGNDEKNSENGGAIIMDPTTNCLHLKLSPVPKMLSLVRENFAPHAFCISFKLETDQNILFEKAGLAIQKYDVHMVIGNMLQTRYEKVWILQNRDIYISDDDNEGNKLDITEVSRSDASSSSIDELEDAMISHVVEKHFEYIANHYLVDDTNEDDGTNGVLPRTALMAGAEAAARHNAYLRDKKHHLQNELYWKRVKDVTLNVAGHAIGMYLTFVASSALQKRLR